MARPSPGPSAPRTRPRTVAGARATPRRRGARATAEGPPEPRSHALSRVHREPALRGGDRAQRLAQPGAAQRRQRARVDAVVGRPALGEALGVVLEADARDGLEG